MLILAGTQAEPLASDASMLFGSAQGTGWVKYAGNPVLGGQYGTCFDVCVLYQAGLYRMWVSWRPKKSVALTQSTDGIHWSPPEIVLGPRPETGWEDDINRPIVVRREDELSHVVHRAGKRKVRYRVCNWPGRTEVDQVIHSTGFAIHSPVGRSCGHVPRCDVGRRESHLEDVVFRRAQYEPDAIGYATSKDGLHWEKYAANPVMKPDPAFAWEKDRVTAAQIVVWKGWYYSFYIGFSDINHAQIGMARSRDGLRNWARHRGNPIVPPTPGGWDADACYKPFAVLCGDRWMLWYNGRHKTLEQIGVVFHWGEDLEFVPA